MAHPLFGAALTIVAPFARREVYRLCTAQPKPFSEKLYYALRAFMTEQVQLMATALHNNDGDVLGDYRTKWETYRMGTSYLSQIFRYLNLNWIRKTLEDGRNRLGGLFQNDASSNTKDLFDIYTLGLVVWKDLVFTPQKVPLFAAFCVCAMLLAHGN